MNRRRWSIVAAGALALAAAGAWLAYFRERADDRGSLPPAPQAGRAARQLSRAKARPPDQMAVRCARPAQAISPGIYGFADGDFVSETARRVGGNPMTRLNYDLGNVWNTGSDWFFENVKGETSLLDWLAEGKKLGVQMALEVPMIGWVAKDSSSVSFPVSRFGPQKKTDPERPEAGNGERLDGSLLTPGPPTLTSVAAPPERIGEWIRMLRAKDAEAGARRVHMYILDNEPDLWHKTHRDVHPQPVTYDELLERTIQYATQIRKADPEALIAGPASWGYTGYFYSAADLEGPFGLRLDRRRHGGLPLIAYYLKALHEHERRTGIRLLDVLDVHYYPQADGVYAGSRHDAQTSALRLRSTRALWDPTYIDESWIQEAVQLIPRLQAWVHEYYPGRAISIGEWNFGAQEHVSGGLATAEALGRFGQLGLDWAFHYRGPKRGTPAFEAFRAFRDFDGAGARFLDFSIETDEAEPLSLFASRAPDGRKLVLVLINKSATTEVEARIDVSECGTVRFARRFRFGSDQPALAERSATGLQGSSVGLRVAPYSLEVLELAL